MSPDAGRRALRGAAALTAVLALSPVSATGQVRVDDETVVRSIRFSGVHSVTERDLQDVMVTEDRGAAYGLRAMLGHLPLIPAPAPKLFSPLEFQRDVVRIRSLYEANGFPDARITYEVGHDEEKNLIDLHVMVEEGRPMRIRETRVALEDSGTVQGAARRRWTKATDALERLEGRRMRRARVRQAENRLRGWWQDRGHPSARVETAERVDSTAHVTDLTFTVSPGPAARFGAITIEGNASLSDAAILRELPFEPGDRYSTADIEEGRSELQQLEIVRLATFEAAPEDSAPGAAGGRTAGAEGTWPVHVRVIESKPRYVSGEVGYVSDAGLSSEARWTHRNFTGSARTFTVSAVAQSGLLAITEDPDERYRGSVSLLQPYTFHRRLSSVLAPFVEHRNDRDGRSLEIGTHATLILRESTSRTLSLDYRIGRRRVYEYGFGSLLAGDLDLLSFLALESQGIVDTLGTTFTTSLVTLSGFVSTIDQPARPRRGLLLRPAVQVTAPPSLSNTSYWQADATAQGFLPLARRIVLAGRFGIGRLFPFGKSLPGPGEDPLLHYLELRDVLFTSGGSGDVRGWDTELLGPKFPDLRIETVGDSATIVADGYVPVGGFSRMSFSAELRLPFPFLGPQFGTHVFLDGGRVWTTDERFDIAGGLGLERTFYAAGSGIDLYTPVGPIKLSVAYQLNPSVLDLAEAEDVFQALLDGTPLSEVPQDESRRWKLHLTIGSTF